jgi:hypothetical protein
VLSKREIEIDSNDDAARIYPGCPGKSSAGRIERGECALAPQKRVSDASSIDVFPYNVPLGITPSNERKRSPREINRGELPKVEYVSMTVSRIIREKTNDFTGRVNSAGAAADCARWIEACEDAVRGPYKLCEMLKAPVKPQAGSEQVNLDISPEGLRPLSAVPVAPGKSMFEYFPPDRIKPWLTPPEST